MARPELVAFFNGAFDMLLAAFTASKGLSSASKGAIRETAPRNLLVSMLPSNLCVTNGDVIDSRGHNSGQLDGVVITNRAPTLRLTPNDPSLIFAESVLAIIEVKSDLYTQWDQVVSKLSKVSKLRPAVVKVPGGLRLSRSVPPWAKDLESFAHGGIDFVRAIAEEQKYIPFFVLGYQYSGKKSLKERVESLPLNHTRMYFMTLNPPRLVVRGPSGQTQEVDCENNGDVISPLWFMITIEAQRVISFRTYPWNVYIGGSKGAELQGDSDVDYLSGMPLDFGEDLLKCKEGECRYTALVPEPVGNLGFKADEGSMPYDLEGKNIDSGGRFQLPHKIPR